MACSRVLADPYEFDSSMRVVHLSYYYGNNTSGAPIAATRLHQALLRAGVESHFICMAKRGEGENVHLLPRSKLGQLFYYLFPRGCWVLSKFLFGKMYMPNLIPLKGLERTICEIKPDVVHIHFIGQDMVSYAQLEKLGAPAVITLHDLSLFNAVEAHPGEDVRFVDGFTRQNSSWIERWLFNRKRHLIEMLKPRLIGPSDWVCSMARKALIGRELAADCVFNIVDPVFAYDVNLRQRTDRFTILFGAYGGRRARYKGWEDLASALALLPKEVKAKSEVFVFGESAEVTEVGGVKVRFLGAINDPKELREIHHAADVFAFPSKHETQGMVKIEALLDGLPVLAFKRTGCAETIEHKVNGWIAPDGDIAKYAKGIEHYFNLWQRGELDDIRSSIAERARAVFAEDDILRKTLAVYEKCKLKK